MSQISLAWRGNSKRDVSGNSKRDVSELASLSFLRVSAVGPEGCWRADEGMQYAERREADAGEGVWPLRLPEHAERGDLLTAGPWTTFRLSV